MKREKEQISEVESVVGFVKFIEDSMTDKTIGVIKRFVPFNTIYNTDNEFIESLKADLEPVVTQVQHTPPDAGVLFSKCSSRQKLTEIHTILDTLKYIFYVEVSLEERYNDRIYDDDARLLVRFTKPIDTTYSVTWDEAGVSTDEHFEDYEGYTVTYNSDEIVSSEIDRANVIMSIIKHYFDMVSEITQAQSS